MKQKFVTLHDSKKSKLILNNKTKKVHKILKDLYIDRTWFESYQKFQEGRSNVVKVFEYISNKEYTMEYIPHFVRSVRLSVGERQTAQNQNWRCPTCFQSGMYPTMVPDHN